MSGGIVYYPGEIKNFKTESAADGALERLGLILKIDNTTTTDPRVGKINASGDTPFGVATETTYNQDELILRSGVGVGVATEGTVMVAVEAATYVVGDVIFLADTSDGYGRAQPSGGIPIGICEEYKVIATGDYTDKTDQVAVRLTINTAHKAY
jgi:hypothetical protein